jgi:puromycin-sensitive aminopeptidase
LVGELRGLLITALAVLGNDSAAQDKCRALHQQSLTDPTHVDPTVATAALSVVASQGTDVDYDACLARYRAATNPQDKLRELHALAKFPTTAQIDRTLAFAMTDEVKTQNAPFVISRCISHRDHGERAWRFLRHHWDVANERFPQNTIARMVDPVKTLTSPAQRADVAAYFSEHDIPQSHKALLQTLERQGVNVALHERAHADLARAFS